MAIVMFLTLYVMSVSFLPLSRLLFDELDCTNAEVLRAATGLGQNSLPDHPDEVTLHRSLASLRCKIGDDESDPADDVVFEIGAAALDRVVDREQQLVADANVQRFLDLLVVEGGARIGAVPAE